MKVFLVFFLASTLFSSEIDILKKVHAHLLIDDHRSALEACEKHLSSYPQCKELKKAYLKVLIRNQKQAEAIAYFKTLEEENKDLELIETLAWGIIARFEQSPHLFVSQSALMSAFYTQDIRGVDMIVRGLKSSNALVRLKAAELSSHYRDRSLIQMLEHMLASEKVWFVRLQVIESLGVIGVKGVKDKLKELLAHPRTTLEEKEAAIHALTAMCRELEEVELKACLTSSRPELRHLACQIISHLNLQDKKEMLEPLLNDPSPEVRIASLNALSCLGFNTGSSSLFFKIASLTEDVHPAVALTAAWIASRYLPNESLKAIRHGLASSNEEVQRLAAYVLGKIGPIGKDLTEEVVKNQFDPFVKVNLALGSIGQGLPSQQFSDIMYTFLRDTKQKVMWSRGDHSVFPLLTPSKMTHIPQIPKYPTLIDKLSRLEVLRILAVFKHPQALEMIQGFLNDEMFEVLYTAALTLLEEGEHEVFHHLKTVVKEGEKTIRIQAALTLALSNRDVEAVDCLKQEYFFSDRPKKLHILAVLGHIGDKSSIPFLINVIEEPYQMIQVMAASALLQCVYH